MRLAFFTLLFSFALQLSAQIPFPIPKEVTGGLSFRSVGPALTSGRVSDLAVNPHNPYEYYVTAASGGVWKTQNAGNTFDPIFDGQGSYSIGCVSIAPSNPNVVWVGTGENNNQRSVGYGDGVYRSLDGGKSWKNMGLKNSEHIGKIIIHPTNPNVVYIAAYGPLWSKGGDRGVYKTTDGGETWTRILYIDEHTGISDLAIDPRDPNILYATAHQRRRHVWTYIGGGPSSGIHKTTDGGQSWSELTNGLPDNEMGRIGIAVSPANPDIVYAVVEALYDKGGTYRSTDRGASWHKQSGYKTSGNYYQEIVCDPHNPDKLFFMDTWLHHSNDGGKTVKQTGEKHKHVDNHAMWIDPNNTDHWILGCDGGLYETWNAAADWHYKPNLPITQFYKVSVDNDRPFYNIYGGTQDNNTLGGPSRTTNVAGILNSDWFITNGGDGFEAQVDPKDPNIVYAQSQYGWLVRYDKQSGERVGIKPRPAKGEEPYRWNWDAPLLISPHNHKRLYFAANRLFKSNDRGSTWDVISPDLTRQLDRNKLPVMGRVWSIDAVMKNRSTTIYGNIVALDESPLQQGLLYVGTDDGLIQVSENDGAGWVKTDGVRGVPDRTYVNMLLASQHESHTVYAVFNNHKRGDFKPYVYRSRDKGRNWVSISGNLPQRGSVYCLAEDPENPNLLFAGTEFGVFVTLDGGINWAPVKGGLPTIAVRDMAIQKRENDLVLGTFGRGFYVLDDYSFLRNIDRSLVEQTGALMTADTALMFVEKNPLGLRGKGSQGEALYTALNPEVGARFTYFLKEAPKTLEEQRREKEADIRKKMGNNFYPGFDDLRTEAEETDPFLLFTIYNNRGDVVQKIRSKPQKGIHHVYWNGRYASNTPVQLKKSEPGRYSMADVGPLAAEGSYTVDMQLYRRGKLETIGEKQSFYLDHLDHQTLAVPDKDALLAFQREVSELRRSVRGAAELLKETDKKLDFLTKTITEHPAADVQWLSDAENLSARLRDIHRVLHGDGLRAKHQFETYPGINDRIETLVWSTWNAVAKPAANHRRDLAIAREEYKPVLAQLKQVVNEVEALQNKIGNTPYTPGRGDEWQQD